VLDQLAGALHRIQLRQLVPGFSAEGSADDGHVTELAKRIGPEDVQLWYQFALNGRRELPYAPDPRSGFEMVLLRMLGFRSDVDGSRTGNEHKAAPAHAHEGKHAAPARQDAPRTEAVERAVPPTPVREHTAPGATAEPVASSEPLVLGADGMPDWEQWIARAKLGGPVGQLARHAAPKSLDGAMLTLALKPEHQPLADSLGDTLQRQLGDALGKPLRLRFVKDMAVETPAARAARARSAEQAAAERAINEDPTVQSLQREFGARVIPESIKPVGREA
jgi:DNA polymerase III subunit gamma/tau